LSDPPAVVGRIEASLRAGGFAVERGSVAGRDTVIARQSQFKLRWMATKLHTFVMVADFGADASPDVLDRYLTEAVQYSISAKGGAPRGLQTGTCAMTVAVTESAGGAGGWAVKPHGRRFAAMAFPVLVDVTAGSVSHPQRMAIGAIYVPYLKKLVQEHIVPSVT
jgi:hypothetical protein